MAVFSVQSGELRERDEEGERVGFDELILYGSTPDTVRVSQTSGP